MATGTTGADGARAYWQDIFRARAHVWRPMANAPAAMLEPGQDVRAWVLAVVDAAAQADPASLETQLFAAVDACAWDRAAAHLDPVRVLGFASSHRAACCLCRIEQVRDRLPEDLAHSLQQPAVPARIDRSVLDVLV